jgi:hypothetical protein
MVHDLSSIDTSRCDSLESWLDAIEQGSDLRPTVTSGTTGKISFFPRSATEADIFARLVVQAQMAMSTTSTRSPKQAARSVLRALRGRRWSK